MEPQIPSTTAPTGTTTTFNETKYQKLASEYAKLRAQAQVLKRAVLDEQSKNVSIRDQLRQRETTLRRIEQEVDSLGFRNKQLEQRVAALQLEIASYEGKKRDTKRNPSTKDGGLGASGKSNEIQDAVIFEELQKKILENAQLTLLNDDRQRDLEMHKERITNLEGKLEKYTTDHIELEKRLRRDIELMQTRNSELETKLVEAASILGSEDALSVTGSDNIIQHQNLSNQQHQLLGNILPCTTEDRIACLEKEVAHWRAQYEMSKLQQTITKTIDNTKLGTLLPALENVDISCTSSTTAAAITVKANLTDSKSTQRTRDSLKENIIPPTNEQLIYNKYSQKYEDLLKEKCIAESRVVSYDVEIEHLQNCLENATFEMKSKDEHIQSINQALQMLEEDLATTRSNYDEQISVLTEQVINLSEQLAACK